MHVRIARTGVLVVLVLAALAVSAAVLAQVYRYKDKDGNWVYTDQPPTSQAESVTVARGIAPPRITVVPRSGDGAIEFVAVNECRCTVEFGVRAGTANDAGHAVVAGQSEQVLLALPAPSGNANIPFDFGYVIGEPGASHSAQRPYRLPFATARSFMVTQAPPDRVTHKDPSSYDAIDFAMPVGTAIHAAREGTVINVAYRFHRGGLNSQVADEANFVQILHEDGTTAIYAHLQMDTVRVRPGQAVRRGEYIANSGNTGFSGGPHLHFVVLRNAGMRSVSVPLSFEGAGGSSVTLRSGRSVEAY
jgi:murein DD-endopeptidase MepM/ murein hydrolase activator NlpD